VIDPSDLLEEAKELGKTSHSREVRRRTAISRAYYAAFHRANEVAQREGYRFDKAERTGMHKHLFRFLERSADIDVNTAVEILEFLKDQRINSDYRLRAEVPMHKVIEAIEQAEYLLTELLPPPEPA